MRIYLCRVSTLNVKIILNVNFFILRVDFLDFHYPKCKKMTLNVKTNSLFTSRANKPLIYP